MSKGLIDYLLDNLFDASWLGTHGEKLTERELNIVKLFGRKGKVLRNIYIPKDNGETSEIDLVFITQKGIFVFESKNYSGWIFGNEKDKYWTASLPNRQKSRFYNPIMQNRTHMKWLGKYVGDQIPLFSIIVFSERCELKKITVDSSDIHVIKRDSTYATVRKIWNCAPDCLDEDAVDELFNQLKKLTNVDQAVKKAHIENVEKKYKEQPADTAAAPVKAEITEEPVKKPEPMICPKCGKEMILRTARKGTYAGKQFYGCSGYPSCRYIVNL